MTEGIEQANGIAEDFKASKAEEANGNGEYEVGMDHSNGLSEGTTHAFDESYMPVAGLQFTVEQDGYRYYTDPQTQRHYSLDTAGYWYVMNADGFFESVDTSAEPEPVASEVPPVETTTTKDDLKNRLRSKEITYDADGFPEFPTNDNGLPILPRNEKEQPYFPVDGNLKPVYPYDKTTKQWTFPVDDCEEPVFARTEDGSPIVPQDQNGLPIFPKDSRGEFIYPLDENNLPMPAVTQDGKRVIPYDDFGAPVIPRDREGRALIHFAADGVTPLSNAEYKVWKQFEKQYKNYPAQPAMMKSREAIDSPLHPLNIAHQASLFMAEMEILQRGRRVRPEDIDLPDMTSAPQAGEDGAQSAANGHAEQASAEDEKAQKRRKFLAAQLKSSKKVTESKKEESASPKEPTKRTTNPLAAEKHKSRSSSKTKRDQSSSPESKHGRKSADKKKDKKKKHHKEKKERRHRRHRSPESSGSDTDDTYKKHSRRKHRKQSSSSSRSPSPSSSSTDSESPAPKRRRNSSKRSSASQRSEEGRTGANAKSNKGNVKEDTVDKHRIKIDNGIPSASPNSKADDVSDMSVSDESRPPSPPRPSVQDLQRLEEERVAAKKKALDELEEELSAVNKRIFDTEKSHGDVQERIRQLESEREEYEKALSCLREHEKRLQARKDIVERDGPLQ